jgi:hypothetical protein
MTRNSSSCYEIAPECWRLWSGAQHPLLCQQLKSNWMGQGFVPLDVSTIWSYYVLTWGIIISATCCCCERYPKVLKVILVGIRPFITSLAIDFEHWLQVLRRSTVSRFNILWSIILQGMVVTILLWMPKFECSLLLTVRFICSGVSAVSELNRGSCCLVKRLRPLILVGPQAGPVLPFRHYLKQKKFNLANLHAIIHPNKILSTRPHLPLHRSTMSLLLSGPPEIAARILQSCDDFY